MTPTGAWHVGVFKKTKHPKESAALALAYSNPEQAKDNFKIMNYTPVRSRPSRRSPTSSSSPRTASSTTRSPRQRSADLTPAWREYEDLLRTAIRNVIDGGDAKKELDTAVARIDAVLARYKK